MGVEANSQNRWQTARERTRLKARYEIHSRVAGIVNQAHQGAPPHSTSELQRLNTVLRYLQSAIKNDLSSFSAASLARDGEHISRPLPTLESQNTSAAADADRSGIPASGYDSLDEAKAALACFLSPCCPWYRGGDESSITGQIYVQPATLATSKFGREFVNHRLLPYLRYCQVRGGQLTLLEYASLLGRHGIVAQLLLGGVDPTICGASESEAPQNTSADATRSVLRLLHSVNHMQSEDRSPVIPMSLWSYIVRAVVEMRMNGALTIFDNSNAVQTCQICDKQSCALLLFGQPCHHHFCEPCLWMHLVQHVPNCVSMDHDVVTCPICHAEFDGFQFCASIAKGQLQSGTNESAISFNENKLDHIDAMQTYQRRRLESLAKFTQLPNTSAELKALTKKNKSTTILRRSKKPRDPIASTWHQALHPIISNHLSQDVRTDRFFKAVVSSPQVVMSYLQIGIDVNVQNEYGQTPLYVACWRGSAVIVRCLLEYGADMNICANGGGTCLGVAKRWGRVAVSDILEKYARVYGCGLESGCSGVGLMRRLYRTNSQQLPRPYVTILIDPSRDHPGAGACIVDDALTEEDLQRLEQLPRSLPMLACDGTDDVVLSTDSNVQHRPTRSYYCDSESVIQDMLQNCVDAARQELKSRLDGDEMNKLTGDTTSFRRNNGTPSSSVFHHIRFLHYEHKGSLLPPHVDLCRIDNFSGHRSTHTFILYLTDCKSGGGTALLQHLNDPKVLAVAQPKRGRALIFPHMCPHSGLEIECAPKILLRGEVIL